MDNGKEKVLYTGRHFWNRKCRKKTWWQQEFAVFKCEATANSVTGHVCVNSNKKMALRMAGLSLMGVLLLSGCGNTGKSAVAAASSTSASEISNEAGKGTKVSQPAEKRGCTGGGGITSTAG